MSSSSSSSSSTTTTAITPQRTTTTIPPKQTTWKDALAGACAGAFAKTAVAPIERVKLVLQLQSSLLDDKHKHKQHKNMTTTTTTKTKITPPPKSTYNNKTALQVASIIYREQGLSAFWRGNVPNVLRQGGTSAINFMLMDVYKTTVHTLLMERTMKWPSNRTIQLRHKRRSVWSSFISGGLAGGTTTTVLYPIEFLRTRLALDVGSSSSGSSSSFKSPSTTTTTTTTPPRLYPRGMRDVFCQTYKSDGMRGLYQGYGIALVGVVLYRALHMGGYDALKTEWMYYQNQNQNSTSKNAPQQQSQQQSQQQQSQSQSSSLSWKERFVAAQTVSLVAGTLCYPIDSIRRRLMMQAGTPRTERKFHNSIQCAHFVFRTEGFRGFYLGLGPNIVRSLGGAILLVGYDMFKVML